MHQPAHLLPIAYITEQIDIKALRPVQNCPVCVNPIGACAGSRDAVCKNCGYKDPCCE